jgi:hypothetical protein
MLAPPQLEQSENCTCGHQSMRLVFKIMNTKINLRCEVRLPRTAFLQITHVLRFKFQNENPTYHGMPRGMVHQDAGILLTLASVACNFDLGLLRINLLVLVVMLSYIFIRKPYLLGLST